MSNINLTYIYKLKVRLIYKLIYLHNAKVNGIINLYCLFLCRFLKLPGEYLNKLV